MTITRSLCAVMMKILWLLLVFQDVDQTGELLGYQNIGIKYLFRCRPVPSPRHDAIALHSDARDGRMLSECVHVKREF